MAVASNPPQPPQFARGSVPVTGQHSTSAADRLTQTMRKAYDIYLGIRGIEIILIPGTGRKVPKPGGGADYVAEPPRAAQIFVLSQIDTGDAKQRSMLDENIIRRQRFYLTGRYDVTMRNGDEFEFKGMRYTLENVDYSKDYKVTAEVSAYPGDFGHG